MDIEKIKKLYPVRNCEFEKNNDDLAVVLFKKTKLSFIDKIFFKKLSNKPYKIDLDETGSFIYENCGGKFSVEDLIQKVKENFGEKVEPAEERVVKFVEQLNTNKLITLYEKR